MIQKYIDNGCIRKFDVRGCDMEMTQIASLCLVTIGNHVFQHFELSIGNYKSVLFHLQTNVATLPCVLFMTEGI